jgi:hypothetical protein
MDDIYINPDPAPPKQKDQRCNISIESDHLYISFDPALPNGPHKRTAAELMAAGALLGIARVLTGKGEEAVMAALDATKPKRPRK